MLLGSLAREVRQGLAVARALAASGDEASAAAAAGYKGPPAGRSALIAAARRRSPERWHAMLDDVVDCERRMKSGAPVGAADFALLAVRWRP
jgi:DNA polymerase III delta subunit